MEWEGKKLEERERGGRVGMGERERKMDKGRAGI